MHYPTPHQSRWRRLQNVLGATVLLTAFLEISNAQTSSPTPAASPNDVRLADRYYDQLFLRNDLLARLESTQSVLFYRPLTGATNRGALKKRLGEINRQLLDQALANVTGWSELIQQDHDTWTKKATLNVRPGSAANWSWLGGPPLEDPCLSLLPKETDFFVYAQIDPARTIETAASFLQSIGFPDLVPDLQNWVKRFDDEVGIENSMTAFGSKLGFIAILDSTKPQNLPWPSTGMTLPKVRFAIILQPSDDRLYSRLDQLALLLRGTQKYELNGFSVTADVKDPRYHLGKVAYARSQEFLIFASDEALLREVLAVHAGDQAGLGADPEFQKLASEMPKKVQVAFYTSRNAQDVARRASEQLSSAEDAPGTPLTQIAIVHGINPILRNTLNLLDGYTVIAPNNDSFTTYSRLRSLPTGKLQVAAFSLLQAGTSALIPEIEKKVGR